MSARPRAPNRHGRAGRTNSVQAPLAPSPPAPAPGAHLGEVPASTATTLPPLTMPDGVSTSSTSFWRHSQFLKPSASQPASASSAATSSTFAKKSRRLTPRAPRRARRKRRPGALPPICLRRSKGPCRGSRYGVVRRAFSKTAARRPRRHPAHHISDGLLKNHATISQPRCAPRLPAPHAPRRAGAPAACDPAGAGLWTSEIIDRRARPR